LLSAQQAVAQIGAEETLAHFDAVRQAEIEKIFVKDL
tara:strand:- start:419 stop:529 length:111 start_codon:yes stop_codon:yes gene_type:complete